jgi:2-dehydropantoate 2-reductase
MKVAVVGIGSLGTVVGALLSKGGLDVTLVDAKKENVAALNENGARLTGNLDLVQPVRAVTPEGMEKEYDLVIYLVKSTYDEQALPQVLPHLGRDSMLITLQNGVPEEKVASFIGRERTLGGAVLWAAELLSPGVSRMTSDPDQMGYEIGELDGRVTERIEKVKAVLDHAGSATITDNLAGVRWSKLLFNVAASGMSTALGSAGGRIIDDDKATDAVIFIVIETVLTARALGIQLEPMRGVDPGIILDIARQDMANLRNLFRNLIGDFRDAKASMLQDLEKGLPCEVEGINGYLSAMAAKAGVAVPVNDQVTQIIRDIQAGKLPLDWGNLDLIALPPVASYF